MDLDGSVEDESLESLGAGFPAEQLQVQTEKLVDADFFNQVCLFLLLPRWARKGFSHGNSLGTLPILVVQSKIAAACVACHLRT